MGRGGGEQWPRGRWGPTTLPGRQQVGCVAKTHRDTERCVIASSTHPTGLSRPVAAPASQAMDTQLNALPTLAVLARTVSGCLNSAFLDISQHFTGHLFRPWIPSSARDIDGGPRRLTRVVLNEQSLPVAGSSRGQVVPGMPDGDTASGSKPAS